MNLSEASASVMADWHKIIRCCQSCLLHYWAEEEADPDGLRPSIIPLFCQSCKGSPEQFEAYVARRTEDTKAFKEARAAQEALEAEDNEADDEDEEAVLRQSLADKYETDME